MQSSRNTSNRVVCLDIEISPREVYVWSGRNYEVDVIEEIKPWSMLCFSWQWMPGKTKVFSQRMGKKYKPGKLDDREVVQKLQQLLNEADVVLTHNGKKFDIKKFNSRCLFHKIKPPSSFHQIDTYQLFKGNFAEDSNKLQEIAEKYGLGSKVKHGGFPLWKACMRGDEKAWKLMEKYNRRDVDLTVAAYNLIKVWIDRKKPLWDSRMPCPECKSYNTTKHKRRWVGKKEYIQRQCQDCGRYFTGEQIMKKYELH